MATHEPRRLRFFGLTANRTQASVSGITLAQVGLFILSALALFVAAQEMETVIRLHTSLPIRDQWVVVVDYDLLRESNFGLSGWFSQQNEHRPLVPRAFLFGDMHLFGGQNYVSSVMGPLLQLASTGLLAGAAFLLFRGRSGGAALFVLFTAFALAMQFTTAQIETFILPFQLVWTIGFTAGAAALAAFVAAGPPHSRARQIVLLTSAVLLAAVSQLSFQYGLWVWVVMIGIGVWRRYPVQWLVPIALAGVALTGAFYLDYSTPAGTATFLESIKHPVNFADFVIIVIGGPVDPLLGRNGARVVGLAGLAAVAFIVFAAVRRRESYGRPETFLLAQALFATLAVCHLAFMRAPNGVADAEAPRYVLVSASLWTAAVILLWFGAAETPRPRAMQVCAVALAGAFVAVAAVSPWQAVPPWEEAFSGLDRTATAIRVGVYDDAALARIYPADGVDDIKPHIPILEKYEISVFHGEDPSELLGQRLVDRYGVAEGLCFGAFDAVLDAGSEVGAGVSGWAWDLGAARRPAIVLLVGGDGLIVGIGDAVDERFDVLANVAEVTDINSGWFGYSRVSIGPATAYAILDGRVACPLVGAHAVTGTG